MRRAALAAALLAAICAARGAAQDSPPDSPPGPAPGTGAAAEYPIEVRIDRTIVEAGTPVRGAWAAFVSAGEGPADAGARAVATDPDGRAIVPGPAAGGVLLVWADARAPVALHLRRAPSAPVVLPAARSLTVVVRKPSGAPQEGAAVDVEVQLPVAGAPSAGDALQTYHVAAVTDAEGRAAVAGLPDGNLGVRASCDGLVDAEVFPVRASDAPVVLALRRGARIEGRATVVPGGAPAAGTVLRAGGASARVAADGSYALTAVPAGTVTLTVDSPDLVLRAPVTLVLRDEERRAGVDLSLLRTAVLSGLVVTPSGDPAGSADISLLWPANTAAGADGGRLDIADAVTPESGGRFRIDGLRPADGVALEVRSPGYAPALVEGLSLAPGVQAAPVRVQLTAGALLAGRVVDPSGAAVAGASVEARASGDAAERAPADIAVTGPGGVFLLDALPPVAVRLRVVPPDGGPWRITEAGPFVPGAQQAADVGALVLRPGHALHGAVAGAPEDARARVVDAEGALREAAVRDGAFTVDGLAAGDALLEIASDTDAGGARAVVRLPAGWPVTLTWQPAAPVVVRLRDAGRRPVTTAELTFDPREGAGDDAPSYAPPPSWTVRGGDVDGVYEVALEPGAWRVTARAGSAIGTAPVDVLAGAGAVLTMDLVRGETLSGFVASRLDGTPVEGAQVVVEPFGDTEMPALHGSSDDRGHFAIDGVRPGIVRVRVEATGHAPWSSGPLAVRASAGADLGQIELVAGGAVVGVVQDASGTPSRGAAVEIEHDDGSLRTTTTDLHGRFRIEHLAAGDMTLRVLGVAHAVRLPLGAPEVFVAIDAGAGVALRGRVTSDGRPEPFARVSAWTRGSDALHVEQHADGDGVFSLPPLPPGDVDVEVLAAGATEPFRMTVTLADAPEDWVEIELPDGGVAGQVRDPAGAGVVGAALWLWSLDEEDRPVEVVSRGTSGDDGRFTLSNVPAGRYEIEARRRGHGEGRSAPFGVRADTLAFGVDVALTEEAVLDVEIVDERGLPVGGGWVTALPYDSGPARVRLRARASADGRAELRSLAPGAYEVAVGGPGRGRSELGMLRLPSGRTSVGRVVLDPGGALRITVLHPGYVPAAGEDVGLEDLLGRDPREDAATAQAGFGAGSTAADGTLFVPDLAPGWYRVWRAGDDPETAYLVQVRSTEVTRVSLWAPWADGD